jgi:putative transposase
VPRCCAPAATNYRHNFLAGGRFFFTLNLTDRRQRLLTDNIALLRHAFKDVRHRHPFAIDAIVVLPDHLHTIWTLPEGDADFAGRWQLIKSTFSRGLARGEASRARSRSAAFGNAGIESTPCETRKILRATSITSISIR